MLCVSLNSRILRNKIGSSNSRSSCGNSGNSNSNSGFNNHTSVHGGGNASTGPSASSYAFPHINAAAAAHAAGGYSLNPLQHHRHLDIDHLRQLQSIHAEAVKQYQQQTAVNRHHQSHQSHQSHYYPRHHHHHQAVAAAAAASFTNTSSGGGGGGAPLEPLTPPPESHLPIESKNHSSSSTSAGIRVKSSPAASPNERNGNSGPGAGGEGTAMSSPSVGSAGSASSPSSTSHSSLGTAGGLEVISGSNTSVTGNSTNDNGSAGNPFSHLASARYDWPLSIPGAAYSHPHHPSIFGGGYPYAGYSFTSSIGL